ncbi:MAG: DUF1080 domain-containing protein [Kordiimonadaceae bacterium]|jgi:hypothetical protein|nr:DUF1080 domain-containing protein [Kordiimonadaceae bacterium]MBT6035678.1 DUF1080 domain-containing protein [Kordiimonadaceae bacterium]MBT6330623.1 DUF1080 domain-containing protein [Kordiimonadaceae bacterium]
MLKKITLLSAVLIAASLSYSWAQMVPEPRATEVWDKEPARVTPGEHGRPPSDAISLNASAWQSVNGDENPWTIEDGVMTVNPGTKDIRTKKSFGDVQLHVEWRIPELDAKFTDQDRGNSGVFLQQFYEVQVLDSYENKTYNNGQAGSLYKQHIPLANATKPATQWQTYDIIYTAPRFSKNGTVISQARITVIHNGVLIQNNVSLVGPTVYIGSPAYDAHGDLPIYLQDHDHEVSYRNIWLREL